jgi:hypothetical protein
MLDPNCAAVARAFAGPDELLQGRVLEALLSCHAACRDLRRHHSDPGSYAVYDAGGLLYILDQQIALWEGTTPGDALFLIREDPR